jgi:hypothetical protein
MADLCILSGCDHLRFNSFINHRLFAEANGLDYIFDLTLTPRGENSHFNKLRSIRQRLERYSAVFWLDDDAYFTDFSWRLGPYFSAHQHPLVICKSPINDGLWTWITSGQFLLRRCDLAFEFLDQALATDLAIVRAWWDAEEYGFSTGGDQDVLVYLLATNERFKDFCERLDYTEFNTRPFHYVDRLSENRLVHFISPSKSKRQSMAEFADRLGVNKFFIPNEALCGIELGVYDNTDWCVTPY